MKKTIFAFAFAAALLLLIAGCSQPNPPVVPPTNGTNGTNGTTPGNGTNDTWTIENSQPIAYDFVLNDETYACDGINGTLTLVESAPLRCVGCFEYTYVFESYLPGYGDRGEVCTTAGLPADCGIKDIGNNITQVTECMQLQPTMHTARVQVLMGNVGNAIMDGEWDMVAEKMLSSQPVNLNDEIGSYAANPSSYVGRDVNAIGVLVNLGTNYFTGAHFALNISGEYVNVNPWVPLEVVQCPQGQECNRPAVMSDYLGEELEVSGGIKSDPSMGTYINVLGARKRGAEGEFCGGIAAFPCATGLRCQLDGDYPDAGGTCVRKAANFTACPETKPDVCYLLYAPVCAEIHIMHPDMAPTYVTWHRTFANDCVACAASNGTSVVVGYVGGPCE